MIGYKFRSFNNDNHWNAVCNDYIWASTSINLNDPFESLIDMSGLEKYLPTNGDVNLERKIYNIISVLHDKKSNSEGIFSFSETWDSELLWAHYADSHSGFCIEYDIETLISETKTESCQIIKVVYGENFPALFIKGESRDNSDWSSVMFGLKSLAWEYEKEIRIVFHSSGKKKYPKHSVKSIILGCHINSVNQKKVIDFAIKRDIPVYKCYFDCKTYRIYKYLYSNPLEIAHNLTKTLYKIINQTQYDAIYINNICNILEEKILEKKFIKRIERIQIDERIAKVKVSLNVKELYINPLPGLLVVRSKVNDKEFVFGKKIAYLILSAFFLFAEKIEVYEFTLLEINHWLENRK